MAPESHEMSRQACLQLIRAGVVARVAVATTTGPYIVPVNYAVDEDTIVLRTTPYSLIGTYGRDAMVAFEIDGFDHQLQRGWSVVVRGRAHVVDDAEELEHVRQSWPRPWASGQRNLVLRIPWTEVSGRQLGEGWNPLEDAPVRLAQ